MTPRLKTLVGLNPNVRRPAYCRDEHGPGIVHIGLGAFHKTHQAVYTDDALAVAGGNWRITGVSLRSPTASKELSPQNGLYTTIERGIEGTSARVIGSIAAALCLPVHRQAVLDALTNPLTRIVSLTVTEKAYGMDRETGGMDPTHPAIAADLAAPQKPQSIAGLLVWAITHRKSAGVPPPTVLCCDNLPENGRMLRRLLVDFARATTPGIVDHIANDIAFPSTMVDCITPARTDETLAMATALLGCRDEAAVECETFRQWVIEDRFPQGRPRWEAGGALFVDDVRPYEEMKLRMLNGAHSMIAYSGFMSGHTHVRDVIADAALAGLVSRHLNSAAATLEPLPELDFHNYASDVMARFKNPHLAHETYQIAMDGTEKMPQRIFAPAIDAQSLDQPVDAFALATACWMRYLVGRKDDGTYFDLRDPRENEIRAALDGSETADDIFARLSNLRNLLPERLVNDTNWKRMVVEHLHTLLARGCRSGLKKIAAGLPRSSLGKLRYRTVGQRSD